MCGKQRNCRQDFRKCGKQRSCLQFGAVLRCFCNTQEAKCARTSVSSKAWASWGTACCAPAEKRIGEGLSRAQRIRIWLVSEWECRDPHPSTERESPGRRSALWIGRRRVSRHGRYQGGQARR